jgi:hypothetical protein
MQTARSTQRYIQPRHPLETFDRYSRDARRIACVRCGVRATSPSWSPTRLGNVYASSGISVLAGKAVIAAARTLAGTEGIGDACRGKARTGRRVEAGSGVNK